MERASEQPELGTALITGASSGIGYEFAMLFARQGYNVVLVARNRAALSSLAAQIEDECHTHAEVCVTDLSRPAAPQELFDELQRQGIEIDVLINDAGFAIQGPFVDNDVSTLLNMLQVNIFALTHLTRLFLPGMVERGRGKILNMSSIGAYMPGPMMAAYFASKAYVLSLSEALSNELRETGVSVTALCPGPTRTRFALRARLTETKAFRGTLLQAADVAREGYECLMKGKRTVIPGFKHKMQMLPTPLVPRRMMAFFARQYHESHPAPNGHDAAAGAWSTAPDASRAARAPQP